jgi:hypothetical protein
VSYDLEYKQGDSDTAGSVLSDANGVLDLTNKTVIFVMKQIDGSRQYEINCSLGGIYQGAYYSAARGGVTTLFSRVETLTAGEYEGEFIVSGTDASGNSWVRHIPSGDRFKSVMIWRSLKVTQ